MHKHRWSKWTDLTNNIQGYEVTSKTTLVVWQDKTCEFCNKTKRRYVN